MTTAMTTPDEAMLWAQNTRDTHHSYNRTMERAEAYRAGQSANAKRVAALEKALKRMVYETTHLSPMKPNGDHDCTIKADALAQARAALGNAS